MVWLQWGEEGEEEEVGGEGSLGNDSGVPAASLSDDVVGETLPPCSSRPGQLGTRRRRGCQSHDCHLTCCTNKKQVLVLHMYVRVSGLFTLCTNLYKVVS